MHILLFSDIHQDWQELKRVVAKKADIYICLGDLSNLARGLEKAGDFLSSLGEKLWLMPGNNETEGQIKTLCQKHGFFNFHRRIKKIGELTLAGLGYSIPTPFNTPGERSEKEFEEMLKKFEGVEDLCLFTHCPPRGTELDILPNGAHAGSQAIREFVIKNKPLYLFSAHIHENAGKVERLAKTTCFSVGKRGLEIWL